MSEKIIITGAAGLVGQNLILLLKKLSNFQIVAIDKHEANINILRKLNPDIEIINADLAKNGDWKKAFENARIVILLHAQITSKNSDDFLKNNITATENVLNVMHEYHVPYIIHASSSVINSVANDDYTYTKTIQEKLVTESGISYCVLRPTLMFGWFDRKHLGWLTRLMSKIPVFPVPGSGKYLRQPLYAKDFCRIIVAALEQRPNNKIYDIVGKEEIYYIEIIQKIKATKKLKTFILKIPYQLFYTLLKVAALILPNPPFTADQLKALTAGDYFRGIDTEQTFGIKLTEFSTALQETLLDEQYSQIILER